MAIALRGTAQTGNANNGNDVTLTFDTITPPLEGDYVIVFGGHGSAVTTLTAPSGYTQIGIHTGSDPIFGAWYKKMGATPDTTVVCSGGGNNADGVAYCCWVLSGVDGTTPIDVTTTTAGPTTSTNPDSPSITPTTSGAWVLAMAGSAVFDGSPGTVSGYSNQLTATRNETNDLTTAGATFAWTSGAEDPAAWDTWASGTWYALTVALRPQADTDTEIIPPAANLQTSTTAPTILHGVDTDLQFEANTDTLTITHNAAYTPLDKWTWEFNYRTVDAGNTGTFRDLTQKTTGGFDRMWYLYINSGSSTDIRYSHGNGSVNNDSLAATLTVGTDYHVAIVKDGDNFEMFVDGSSVATNTIASAVDGNTANWIIGPNNDAQFLFDENRIWNYVRTAAEITRDKDIRLQGSEEGLIGYWRLNDATGTTATDDSTTANNGTTSGAVWGSSPFTKTGDGIETPEANLQFSSTAPTISIDLVGGDVAIEIPAANLQLSTTAAFLDLGISPAAADLQLSTTTPIRSLGLGRIPDAANLQLSTTAATADLGISSPAANLELSTTTPTIALDKEIIIPAAQVTISTSAPSIGIDRERVIPAAQLQLSTTAPDISVPVGITIPAANLEISTTALSVDLGLVPTAANLQLSTTTPILTPGIVRTPPAAQLQVSTTALSVDLGLVPTAANLQLSTTTPVVAVGFSLVIPAANLELSTTVPDLLLATNRIPPAGQLEISTTAPAVEIGREITIPAAQVQLSTSTPILTPGTVRTPPAANLELSTTTPVLTPGLVREPPAAQLQFSTTAPTISILGGNVDIEIPAAQLELSTFAPLLDVPSLAGVAKHNQGTLVGLKHMMGM